MLDRELYKKIRLNWDNLGKPIDGLGEFEHVLSQIGAIQHDEKIMLSPAALLVFISDNGIIEEGVSQSTNEVTFEVAKALGKNVSTVCHMAKTAGIKVYPVNVGIAKKGRLSGVEDRRISYGTKNFSVEPAMTEKQLHEAIQAGRECVRNLKQEGIRIICLGEMGIGNTTTSAAVVAGLKKLSGKQVCSKGAGLDSEGLKKKINIVDYAIIKYNLHNLEPMEILRTVGGYDIAALMGAILECAELDIPVVSDGYITGAAALLALRINPEIKDNIIFSHAGRENGMSYILDEFNAKPVIHADMALGEGTGACIFISAAKCALSVYEGNTLFSDINIDNYKRYK